MDLVGVEKPEGRRAERGSGQPRTPLLCRYVQLEMAWCVCGVVCAVSTLVPCVLLSLTQHQHYIISYIISLLIEPKETIFIQVEDDTRGYLEKAQTKTMVVSSYILDQIRRARRPTATERCLPFAGITTKQPIKKAMQRDKV